ncbi:MAG: amidophosphoribosyltransferase [Acidobacteria bacterium RIFCSPLOWO2_12_FULL_54_10]|nr:MAG: amidophosphoribosyltransferase [Acidobacteria bacterium RIFCSPLOWO2_12_FULL_54_10]
MDDKFHDECGIVGVYGHPEAAKLAYLSLYAQQHRGQESAGIVSSNGKKICHHKGMGQVADVFSENTLKRLRGWVAIGHTRYSTAGDTVLLNAQPLTASFNRGLVSIAHNGNLTNARQLRKTLEDGGSIFQTTSDTEVILHLIARSKKKDFPDALAESLLQLEGAYSLVVLHQDHLYAVRDPRGFRPLVMGILPRIPGQASLPELTADSAFVFASETCAFDLIGAQTICEVQPGEIVQVNSEGYRVTRFAPENQHSFCIFEHVYFARPDSMIFGRSVHSSRDNLGRRLAREAPADADIVVPVPDSGVAAAVGYSAESGLPFHFALIRNHYVGRTFIEPEQSIRDFGVKLKLNPVRSILEGKRVVLVDDSIVRGTTSRKIVRIVREGGASEVHVRISCPPTISPCFYGIDTPTQKELIASSHNVEEIRQYLEADSLVYLSLEGLLASVGDDKGEFCTACYTGNYPTKLVQLQAEANQRR